MGSPVLGIDLGTTNTVVASFDAGAARVLPDRKGRRLTPSVVSFHPSGSVLVGADGRDRRLLDASHTIFSVKRLIGRPFRSPEVQRAAENLPFSLSEGPGGGVVVQARGESYSLPEISALVLRHVRAQAEAALGTRCGNAVVTVPANFNELQRTATRDAGRIAGLNVLRIVNEPTAAALAYGYSAGTHERIAVYDLGGGTFDVSVLDLSGDVIEVIATAGDSYLGGDDIDIAVASLMAKAFLERHKVDLSGDRQAYERLRMAGEWLKCQLSGAPRATCRVEEVAYGKHGKAMDLEFTLTREELDRLSFPIVGRTFDICEDALRVAGLRPAQLDNVVLVGGQTASPLVRKMVADYFGRTPLSNLDPSEVVAQGAAILGHTVSGGVYRGRAPRSTRPPAPKEVTRIDVEFDEAPTRVSDRLVARDSAATRVAPPPVQPPAAGDSVSTTLLGVGSRRPVSQPGAVAPPAPPPAALSSAPRVAPTAPRSSSPVAPAERPAAVAASLPSDPRATVPSRPSRLRQSPIPDEPTTGAVAIASVALRPSAPPSSGGLEKASAPPSDRDEPLRGESSEPPSTSIAAATASARLKAPPVPLEAQPGITARGLQAPPIRPTDEHPPTSDGPSEQPRARVDTPPERPSRRSPVPGGSRSSEPGAIAANKSEPAGIAANKSEPAGIAADKSEPAGIAANKSEPVPPSSTRPSPAPDRPRTPGSASVPPPSARARSAPLLLDVTPHTLAVETTGGYCEQIIERNAPIPTEQTRRFSTSQDNQALVRVRVCQGEDRRVDDNQQLGAVELTGLRRAARGEVKIDVTFMIDADGTLDVKARDQATGKAQAIRIDLVGALSDDDIERARKRQGDLEWG